MSELQFQGTAIYPLSFQVSDLPVFTDLFLLYFVSYFTYKVHLFVGSSWNSGPSVDYMFFRNNTPNEAKLSTQLLRSAEQCAYCCQCSWTHTAVERTLVQGVSGDPQWTCAGH